MRTRLTLALAVGASLWLLPELLSQGFGPTADFSSRLGLASGVSAGTFLFLFLGGVLTSLTPCVYPLIPITVGVFGARDSQSRLRSVALSATYVAGIAAMYSLLGVFAALSGRAFGSVMSSPWVIGIMAVLLLALAASMFGAFEVALPFTLQQRLNLVKGAGFPSAFTMGLVAGIIAAPCTGPVLAGVLAYVSTTRNAALGFWMMFTYAIGMGLLFFILGATSMRLPRSGAWMETAKSVLGVALVVAALAMVLPLLPHPGELRVSARSLGVFAAALAFGGVLVGALSLSFHGGAREKTWKAVGLAILFTGVALQFGWFGPPRPEKPAQIPWLHDETLAVKQSQATHKPLLIDFGAEWCAACKELDKHTWTDPVVAREVEQKFVPLKVDAT
ncbi:MAG TPA: cytochrome c biogenesis protein CcdA, partial [Myxococcales bacterium]|nr:cytochrome c biogenesis protein CcdA [Myxococcales bacterium]